MGFKRGTKPGAPERKGHRWINSPNNAHRVCTKCGFRIDILCVNGENISTYTTKDGFMSEKCPDCITQ